MLLRSGWHRDSPEHSRGVLDARSKSAIAVLRSFGGIGELFSPNDREVAYVMLARRRVPRHASRPALLQPLQDHIALDTNVDRVGTDNIAQYLSGAASRVRLKSFSNC